MKPAIWLVCDVVCCVVVAGGGLSSMTAMPVLMSLWLPRCWLSQTRICSRYMTWCKARCVCMYIVDKMCLLLSLMKTCLPTCCLLSALLYDASCTAAGEFSHAATHIGVSAFASVCTCVMLLHMVAADINLSHLFQQSLPVVTMRLFTCMCPV